MSFIFQEFDGLIRLIILLYDNKIKHQDSGDGCPELQQRSCDFICYITERDNEQKTDPLRVSELKEWLYNNIANERITKAAESIGITKDEIIDGFKSDQFGEIIRDIMGEPECPQK